jgi:PPOX class probable F420-dependent enzyme
MPDGNAQTQLVWYSLDGNDILVNTTRQRRKGRNLAADPRATILVVDPADSARWIEVRGDADLVEAGALDHLDALTRAYTRHEHFYGGVYPLAPGDQENRVMVRLHPRRITCDAIHHH